jgi:hypothetical protein
MAAASDSPAIIGVERVSVLPKPLERKMDPIVFPEDGPDLFQLI